MLRRILIPAIIVISNAAMASANTENCEWKTGSVRFNIEAVTNLNGADRSTHKPMENLMLDGPVTERVINGTITVVMSCDTGDGFHLKDLTVPATARLSLYGAAARIGSLGAAPLNTGFYIRNVEGKRLRSAIGEPFHGGKLAVTLGFAIVANPNFSFMTNQSGMFITDMESIIGVGPTLALGVMASYSRLKLYADFSRVSEQDAQLLDRVL